MESLNDQTIVQDEEKTIIVDDVCKTFRVYKDKSHTLKSRVLSSKRNRYKLNHVLNHISFSLKKGDVVGLIGHNGCGKSTTLKLLNRILYPDSGTIQMNGKISSLIELGAGFHPDMTGRENIYINATIFGLKKHEIDERLDEIIRFSELEEFIDNPVRTYSSGMYMRLAFSIAINVDADILLVDEILAVGDANFQKKCFDKLQEIKYEGVTIVIVSHSMEQIKSICNRVIWLEDGRIKEDGDPRVVCQDYLMAMDEKAAERRKLELEESGQSEKEDPNLKYPVKDVNIHCSPSARRMGNMRTRYRKVELCGEDGEKKTEFRIGDSIRIRGQIISEDQDAGACLIIKIFNRFGGHCATIESKWDFGMKKFQDSLDFNLLLKSMRLVPGVYYIECAIRDRKHQLADNITHFMEFSVGPKYNDERDNLGVIYTDYEWQSPSGETL